MDPFTSSSNTSNMTTASEGPCKSDTINTSWVPPYMYTIAAVGILLNLLVLLVFLLHKKNCTATEIYLSNMATADLLLVLCMPLWGVYEAKNHVWIFGGPMCKISSFLVVINYNSSIYFLVLVCIDRYVALVHPLLQCKLRRRKYAKLSCILVWSFGLLLNIPTLKCRKAVLVSNENFSSNIEEYKCTWICSLHYHLVNELIQTIAAFVIPLLIILFCTMKIIHALGRRPTQEQSTLQTEHKATILVLAVLLAFLICWFPFILTRMIELAVTYDIIKETCTLGHYLIICRHLFLNLGFFNSDLNPILYVLVGKNFRKKMWEVMRSCGLVRKSTTVTSYLFNVNANQC